MGKAGMKRGALAMTAAVMLAGCSSAPQPKSDSPQASAPPPGPPPISAPPASRQSAADQCGAGDLAYLVGRPRSDIPVPVDPSLRRVACVTCPVTMDFNPRRLNILFDAATGLIKDVKCG